MWYTKLEGEIKNKFSWHAVDGKTYLLRHLFHAVDRILNYDSHTSERIQTTATLIIRPDASAYLNRRSSRVAASIE